MEKLLTFLKKKKIVLYFIVFLAFCLRFYQLGEIPSSLNRDEPAIGYNSYSLLKTGKDEWGKKFPLGFKSFGDYKSPLYIYLTVLAIKIFGLTEFSVRFWAALAGVLTVLVIYFLGEEIFKKEKLKIGLMISFLLAISPWHIFYSRFSFEANLALFFNSLIIYLLVKRSFKKIDLTTIFLFLLTFFTYSSSLVIWPLFIFIWTLFLLKKIIQKGNNKRIYQPILKIATMFLILGLVFYQQVRISAPKKRITIFSNPQLRLDFNQKRTIIAKKDLWQARLFYNQYIYYGGIFITKYLKSFSFNFLFGGGGRHPWHKIPQMPHFYLFFFPLIIIGLIYFFSNSKISPEKKFFFLLFFLLSPIASAMTIDAPHSTRLLNLFFLLTFFAGFGLVWLVKRVKILAILVLFYLVFNFFQFTKLYFIDYRQNPPLEILPGLKETILYLNNHQLKEDKIIFASHDDGAYAYLLFYSQYPPFNFLNEVKRYSPDSAGLEWVEKFNKFVFVENPQSNKNNKEIYVKKGSETIGQRKIIEIKNKFNDKIYYTISANF